VIVLFEMEYWNRFCGNMYSGDTGSLCYWNYSVENISEENIGEWELAMEHKEFMSDWDEYINGR